MKRRMTLIWTYLDTVTIYSSPLLTVMMILLGVKATEK
jgi:hypothetical protein